MLAADDPAGAARLAIDELDGDQTDRHLAYELPDAATVLVVGWPDLCALALRGRGDVEVLVVDSRGDGQPFVRRLRDRGNEAALVLDSGAASAAAVADLVLVEALAAGPGGLLAAPGSLAAAAVAAHQEIPVWAVAGVGRVLPERLWEAMVTRLDDSGAEPWDRPVEVVPATLLTRVLGPDGAQEVEAGLRASTCPASPEPLPTRRIALGSGA